MKISKLTPSKRKTGRYLVFLENGDILRVGQGELADFSLYAGMELTEETLAALEGASREGNFRDKALAALTARSMSRKGLLDKLRTWEATEAEAQRTADWLERLGLLNDEEYAKALVRHYGAKGYGPYRIRDELYRRGVPREYWDEALDEAEDPAEAIDTFLRRKLARGSETDPKALKRASDALARRGFQWKDINSALRRYGAELEEE